MTLRSFDKRTLKRNLEKGVISDADYKKHLASLADDADNSEIINLEEEEDEFLGDDEVTQDLSEEA
ncbi:hypothetical protein K1X76_11120 [bacterium]|nr:hypothetical protein [bacterium]